WSRCSPPVGIQGERIPLTSRSAIANELRAAIEADQAAAPEIYYRAHRLCGELLRQGDGAPVALFALSSIAREWADRLEAGEGVRLGDLLSWASLASTLADALEQGPTEFRDPLLAALIETLYPPTRTN
ncbi:MAG TPA: hypothetical protein VFE03_03945, partial [Caulobacteraceae bacterium]|nr:hypothetical protein [Caulobacteraceae bacterium]